MPLELTPLGLFEGEIFSNVNFFLIFVIFSGGLIGMASRSFAIAGFGAMIMFIPIAVNADIALFTNAMYVVMAGLLFNLGFKVWDHLHQSGGTET